VPVGQTVSCFLSPLKAIPVIKHTISKPSITVAGRTMVFPVEIESGCYLEFNRQDDCRLYGSKREFIRQVKPEGEVPILETGMNQLAFQCEQSGVRSRANVTVITHGDTPLRR